MFWRGKSHQEGLLGLWLENWLEVVTFSAMRKNQRSLAWMSVSEGGAEVARHPVDGSSLR